jgi:hypothetical protein
MREDGNPERQNGLDEQQRRNREREIDRVEFGSDFFDDLPDRTETLDKNLDKNNRRTK